MSGQQATTISKTANGIKFIRVPTEERYDPKDSQTGLKLGDGAAIGDKKFGKPTYLKVEQIPSKHDPRRQMPTIEQAPEFVAEKKPQGKKFIAPNKR